MDAEKIEDYGNVEKTWEASSGKGRNIVVNTVRYFLAKDNPNVPDEINVGDMVKFEYTNSGRDGSLKIIHRMSKLTSDDVDAFKAKNESVEEIDVGKPPEKESSPMHQLVTVEDGNGRFVQPIADIGRIQEAWQKWQSIKAAVVGAGDVQKVERLRNGVKEEGAYIKKSGWRKIQVAYGLRIDILDKERLVVEQGEKKVVLWNITAKATAPNGSSATAIGSCNSGERAFAHGESDILMTAQTRATNRAISDVVGSGEVSAEEMKDD